MSAERVQQACLVPELTSNEAIGGLHHEGEQRHQRQAPHEAHGGSGRTLPGGGRLLEAPRAAPGASRQVLHLVLTRTLYTHTIG